MSKGIKARETTLSGIFSPGEQLCMPPYQRSYSWGESEALELLNDFRDAAENGGQHFVGAVVVVRTDAGPAMEIVDGQQRLTTLTILLAVLRDLSEDPAEAARLHALIGDGAKPMLGEGATWRLTLNHVDGPFFREMIQEQGKALGLASEAGESDSQQRMTQNAGAFIKALKQMGADARLRLAETLISGCNIVKVTVDDRDDGYKVFRVLNTRGKEPNAHDIIKTELFETANFTVDEANKYAAKWLDYEARLGGAAFDDLLRQIRALYDKSPKGDLVAGFRKAVLPKVKAREFLGNLLPLYVEAYAEIATGQADIGIYSEQVNAHLNHLRSLEHHGWRAPALKYLVEQRGSPEKAPDFFADLERLGFVIQLIIHDRDQRNKRYRKVIDAIGNDKNLFHRNGPFSVSRDEARKIRERLLGRFATFTQRRSMALRLNAALANGESLAPEADATVEHVLPRNPEDDSYWLTIWPDPAKRREMCDTLGNFILLPHLVNQLADRKDFRDKKAIYFAPGNKVFALTEDLRGINSWTADVVRRRTEKLADILCEAWGIPAV